MISSLQKQEEVLFLQLRKKVRSKKKALQPSSQGLTNLNELYLKKINFGFFRLSRGLLVSVGKFLKRYKGGKFLKFVKPFPLSTTRIISLQL